jgi:hypothetical protein
MIKDKCFTEEWLDKFKKQKDHKKSMVKNLIMNILQVS